ncbi:MAG: PAS domain S-box protein [Calditrichaeota bacterium]|nr:MAG: PAS domain S-box protein [Calditrichota bacterium]
MERTNQPGPIPTDVFQQALNRLPVLTLICQKDGRIVFISEARHTHPFRLLGLPEDARNIQDFPFWQDPVLRQALDDLLTKDLSFDIEKRYMGSESPALFFKYLGSPIHNDQYVIYIGDITERSTIARDREKNIANYKTLFESSPSGIMLIDKNGMILEANKAMHDLLEYDHPGLNGKPLVSILDPSQKGIYQTHIRRILNGETINHTVKDITRHGQQRYVNLHETRFLLTNNQYGVLSIAQDITAIVEAEKALKKERDIIRTVLDTIPGEVSWISRDMVYLGANRALAEKRGISREQFNGKRVGFHKGGKAFYNFVKDFFASDLTRLEQEVVNKLNGQDRDYIMVAQKYNRGNAAVFIGIDITERKETEKRIKQQEKFSRNIIKTAPAMVVILHEPDIIAEFNIFAQELTGYRKEEVIGKSFTDLFIKPAWQSNIRKVINALFNETSTYCGEPTPIRTKSGETLLISWQNARIEDPLHHCAAILAIGLDVTEQKKMEETLLQAQKMEAIGRLAGGVAHDFNNLLTVIQGYTDLLSLKIKETQGARAALDEIGKAVERAHKMTSQLLAFSRKQVLNPQLFDIRIQVEQAHKILRHLLPEDINLTLNMPDHALGVYADAHQFESVIINLVVNARDAMPEGGVITINAGRIWVDEALPVHQGVVLPGEWVQVEVADTGTGIPTRHLEAIFDPFFTTKETGKGTGLGLSMIFGIIKQSGGEIDVHSQPGKGTRFIVYLPYKKTDSSLLPVSALPRPTIEKFPFQSILIVEDNHALRHMLADFMQNRDITVYQADNGEDGLRLFREHAEAIDLVLTDVLMPKMNGKAMTDHIRAIKPDIPVLYISGHSRDIIKNKAQLEAGTALIEKPFTLARLSEKLHALMTPND